MANPQAWIGSADLMHRNLDRRVEVLVQIPSRQHVNELGDLLDLGFDAGSASWWLEPDGVWTRHNRDADGQPLADVQAAQISLHRRRRDGRAAAQSRNAARDRPDSRRVVAP